MINVPDSVRHQAVHPFTTLSPAGGFTRVDAEYCHVLLHQIPIPQMVEPRSCLQRDDVAAAIEEARSVVRDYGRDLLVWVTSPDLEWLPDELASHGLQNEDAPGFESVENAMVLLEPPPELEASGVITRLVETFDEFAAGRLVEDIAFGMSEEVAVEARAGLPERWAEYQTDTRHQRWNAWVDGEVVGTATGAYGEAGVNLFGGAVLPAARSCGVYRALVRARWNAAVERGTPALTVQAGRMSMPILAQQGFIKIAELPVYVDRLG